MRCAHARAAIERKQKRLPASSPFLETVNTLEGAFVFLPCVFLVGEKT